MNRTIKQGIVLLLLLSCVFVSFASNLITGLQKNYSNQISLIGSAPFHFNAFNLNNPPRLVVDIDDAAWSHSVERQELANTVFKDIRVGHFNKKLRLVFDLAQSQNAKLTASYRNHEYQLQINLQAPTTIQAEPDLPVPTQIAANNAISSMSNPEEMPEAVNTPMPGRAPNIVVVIDPGHGGKDPGASGPHGIHEKNIVLPISRYLYQQINQMPGFSAQLTRTGDYYLTLRQRLAIARRDKADMFIAIHADAYRDRTAHGATVYALSKRGATSEAARWIAQQENQSELMGGVDSNDHDSLLRSVLISLSQTATIRASLQIGAMIIQSLGDLTSLHHHKVEQAAFVVLKSPDIPSLLIETGYISNPAEEQRLTSPQYQQKLATELAQGIRAYFVRNPPQGTWLARQRYAD